MTHQTLIKLAKAKPHPIHDILMQYTQPGFKINKKTKFTGLGIDEIDGVESVMKLEEYYGKDVPDSFWNKASTVGDLHKFFEPRRIIKTAGYFQNIVGYDDPRELKYMQKAGNHKYYTSTKAY